MMKLTIGYTPRAIQDLRAISAYLRPRSPSGERNVLAAIRAAARQLSEFPESGIATDLGGVRVVVVQGHPYQLYYRPGSDKLDILHIRHTSRVPFIPGK